MSENERRIFGPPGAGKSTFVTRQVVLDARRYGEANIAVTSFTKAAAATIVDRSVPIPERNVGTLHAFCYRALSQPPLAEDKLPAWNDEHPEYALGGGSSLDESPADAPGNGEGDKLLAKYVLFRNKLFPRELWAEEVERFAAAWEDFKDETATVDFTDLIEIAHRELEVCPGAPMALFVDEAQDLVPLQLALIRKWGEKVERLYLCMDDDQVLYTWLGAEPERLLYPDIPEDQKRVLAQSYRVPRAVKDYADTWTARLRTRQPKTWKPRDAEGEVRRLHDGDFAHPWAILRDAERYLAEGKSVMFLASCSYMVAPLVKALRERGIPFGNKYRVTRGDWNPLAKRKGTSAAQRILAYLKNARGGMWSSVDVARWAEPLMAEEVMRPGAKKALKGWEGSNPFEPTINELLELFEDVALARLFESDLDFYLGHLLASKRKPLEFPIRVAERRGPEALERPPLAITGTIHSVKGGEADVVYLFPDLSLSGYDEFVKDPDPTYRLVYVGATRAKETLILCPGASPRKVEL